MATTADKDRAGQAASTGPHLDFNTFPTSAIVSYIEHYNLAPSYPPPPPPRASSHSSSSPSDEEEDDEEADGGGEGAEDEEGANANVEETKTEEEILAEASGKRRAALASAAATSTSYGPRSERFRARSPPATTTNIPTNGSSSRKRTAQQAHLTGVEGEAGVGAGEGQGEEECPDRFFDEEDAKTYLSGIAQKHFGEKAQPKEGEVVVSFLYRCRARDKALKIP